MNATSPLLVSAGLCLLGALLAWARGAKATAFVLGFGAAHLCATFGIEIQSLGVRALGHWLYAPLLLVPGLRLPRLPRALFFAVGALISAWFLANSWAALCDPERTPRPIVTEAWDPSYPMRVRRPAVVLLPRLHHARVLSEAGRIRIDWPPHAGQEQLVLSLANAGPAEQWTIERGHAALRDLPGSTMEATLLFPEGEGGSVEIHARPHRGPTRLLLLAGIRGDVATLERILDSKLGREADAIFVLGESTVKGDFGRLLAVEKVLARHERARVVAVPGPGDRGRHGLRAFDGVFGPARGEPVIRGLQAVLLDGEPPLPTLDQLRHRSFLIGMGSTLATTVVLSHAPLLPDAEAAKTRRELLLGLRDLWGVRTIFSARAGDSADLKVDQLRQIIVGYDEEHVGAAALRFENGSFDAARFLRARRESSLMPRLRNHWAAVSARGTRQPEAARRVADLAALLFAFVAGLALSPFRIRSLRDG